MDSKWLTWGRQLQAIAQTGLTYAQDPYDIERYQSIRQLAAELLAAYTGTDADKIADLFARETGYATPKIDVRGVVFQDDKILLVKERANAVGFFHEDELPPLSIMRVTHAQIGRLFEHHRHPHWPTDFD